MVETSAEDRLNAKLEALAQNIAGMGTQRPVGAPSLAEITVSPMRQRTVHVEAQWSKRVWEVAVACGVRSLTVSHTHYQHPSRRHYRTPSRTERSWGIQGEPGSYTYREAVERARRILLGAPVVE